MLEMLRRQLVCRFQHKLQRIAKCKGLLCPRIQDKVNHLKIKALDYEAFLAGEGIWEIQGANTSWVVDLNQHKCTCRVWNVTGIPYMHATCAILTEHATIEEYVTGYFHVAKYKQIYEAIIHPIPDPKHWIEESEEISQLDRDEMIMPPYVEGCPGDLRGQGKKVLRR
ncbi:hypothetical protein Salat_2133000 [Sesamum alatum]|uniref:Zinc finger PMZ-type domain-containing protein n=1 Tax=Sesamum alatum TaxID=300844 RepID=A0AAE1Y1B3_9LAMI|nr:hypothetical protein Salat_2133000 [Sesamum alatum]